MQIVKHLIFECVTISSQLQLACVSSGDHTGLGAQLMEKLAFVIARLEQAPKNWLSAWLTEMPHDHFASRCVRAVQYYLGRLVGRQVSHHSPSIRLCSYACCTPVAGYASWADDTAGRMYAVYMHAAAAGVFMHRHTALMDA